jgi:hypothetical protein
MLPRFGRRAAARWECGDAQDADRPTQGQRNHLPDADFAGAFEHAFAIDTDMALIDQGLGGGSAFDDPDAVQEAIDPHWLSA